jgi:hypothetical protein
MSTPLSLSELLALVKRVKSRRVSPYTLIYTRKNIHNPHGKRGIYKIGGGKG